MKTTIDCKRSMRIFSPTTTHSIKSLFAQLSPQDCALCGAAAVRILGTICLDCERGLPRAASDSCMRCAAPVPSPTSDANDSANNNILCGACVVDLPHFDHTVSAFRYEFPLDRLIQAYKFNANLALTSLLSTALADRVKHDLKHRGLPQQLPAQSPPQSPPQLYSNLPDLIMPTPLAAKRLAERGFNQSALLGSDVAKQLGIPFSVAGLRRVRETWPQTGLKRDERLKNVRGAFECATNVQGMRIAVVDDVMTTGATFSEIAKALKKNGAIYVEAWTVARALHH